MSIIGLLAHLNSFRNTQENDHSFPKPSFEGFDDSAEGSICIEKLDNTVFKILDAQSLLPSLSESQSSMQQGLF